MNLYLDAHPTEWKAFRAFFEDAVAYSHTLNARVRIGTSVTFNALSGPRRELVKALGDAGDVTVMTYFPVDSSFLPRSPYSVARDLSGYIQGSFGNTQKLVAKATWRFSA
jgi:hypothetical protein